MIENGRDLTDTLNKLLHDLVERGRELEAEGADKLDSAKRQLRTGWQRRLQALEDTLDDRIEGAMRRAGVPDRKQLLALEQRTAELEAACHELSRAADEGAEACDLVLHVVPDGSHGWKVESEDDRHRPTAHTIKAAAIDAARALARSHMPSRLVVHRKDGTIQKHWSYSDQ